MSGPKWSWKEVPQSHVDATNPAPLPGTFGRCRIRASGVHSVISQQLSRAHQQRGPTGFNREAPGLISLSRPAASPLADDRSHDSPALCPIGALWGRSRTFVAIRLGAVLAVSDRLPRPRKPIPVCPGGRRCDRCGATGAIHRRPSEGLVRCEAPAARLRGPGTDHCGQEPRLTGSVQSRASPTAHREAETAKAHRG